MLLLNSDPGAKMASKIDRAIEYVEQELKYLNCPRTYGDDDEYWASKTGKVEMLEEVLVRLRDIKENK